MYKGKSIVAIVMARGGSKGLPRKNTKILNNKPLIAWTLLRISESKYVDNTIISTDDREIADICSKYGFNIDELRPESLATDTTTSYEVLDYLLEKSTETYDYILLLEPTSPLRKKDDIDEIIMLGVDNNNADGVISVGEVHTEHPGLLKELGEDGYLRRRFDEEEQYSLRQMNKPVYFPYGVGYLMKCEAYLNKRTIYTSKMIPFFIERWQNYEIDDIYDFICIEAILKEREDFNEK